MCKIIVCRIFEITMAVLLIPTVCYSQRTIDIESCYLKAQNNHPLIKEYNILELMQEYNIANASKGYLPQVDITSSLSYQSDVIGLPVEIPNLKIDKLNKEQYQISFKISQHIWDGGNISTQKKLIKQESIVNQKSLNVQMYALKECINEIYFSILLLKKQIRQNEIFQEILNINYDNTRSCIDNGISENSDLKNIEVEVLKAEQKEEELLKRADAYCGMLSLLTGDEVTFKDSLIAPSKDNIRLLKDIRRPELDLFQSQEELLIVQRKSIIKNSYPNIGFFFQGAYGNPGLNLLKNEATAYFITGIGIKWNLGSLYTLKNNIKLNKAKHLQLKIRKDNFLLNTNLDIIKEDNEIDKLYNMLEKDNKIVQLKKDLRQITQNKRLNGMASINDLLTSILSEELANQNKILNEIYLLMWTYKKKQTLN